MLAIVLSRKNLREYDQIVTLYTRERGKAEVLAKGIKKITSKNSANLEVLAVVEAETALGKEVEHLTKVQPVKIFKNIYSDFDKIWLAQYVVKLTEENILPAETDEKIFNLLLSFLEFLDFAQKINSLNLATGFIFKFWHCLGFGAPAEKHRLWLEEGWETINNLNLPQDEQSKIHNLAIKFAEHHSGRQVFTFSALCVKVV